MDRALPSEGNISQITNQDIDQSPERIIEHKKVNKCFAGISRIKKETKTTIASTDIDGKICPANKEQNVFSTLKQNKVVIDGVQYHSCHQREYKTKRFDNLNNPCNQCKYKATDKPSLRKHIRPIHEGQRYPCDRCDYKATQTGNLRIHKLKYHV